LAVLITSIYFIFIQFTAVFRVQSVIWNKITNEALTFQHVTEGALRSSNYSTVGYLRKLYSPTLPSHSVRRSPAQYFIYQSVS